MMTSFNVNDLNLIQFRWSIALNKHSNSQPAKWPIFALHICRVMVNMFFSFQSCRCLNHDPFLSLACWVHCSLSHAFYLPWLEMAYCSDSFPKWVSVSRQWLPLWQRALPRVSQDRERGLLLCLCQPGEGAVCLLDYLIDGRMLSLWWWCYKSMGSLWKIACKRDTVQQFGWKWFL